MSDRFLEPLGIEVGATYRHWCPLSEKYTGGDALFTALGNGWRPIGPVVREDFWLAGVRRICVYHVKLSDKSTTRTMAVIDSPSVSRFVRSFNVQVVQENQRKHELQQQ